MQTQTHSKTPIIMNVFKQRFLMATFVGLAFLTSCKKNDVDSNSNPNPNPTPAVTEADKMKDSALAYSKDIYLWYNQIPSTFNARSYADLNKLMTAFRAYSIEPGTTSAADRWSFAIKQQEWDNASSGISGDFGLNVFFLAEGDLRVKSVEKTSPAGLAGIKRGWKITSLNGNSNITTSNAEYIVNAVWNSSSTQFGFEKPDGSSVNMNLSAATYQEHPVFLDSVYSIAS